MTRAKVCTEEQSIYGIAQIEEGNWMQGQFTVKGASWGLVEMPLSFLPKPIQRRLQKGEHVHLRLSVAEDSERRVNTEGGRHLYQV